MAEKFVTGFRELDLCPSEELRVAVISRVLTKFGIAGWLSFVADACLVAAILYCIALGALAATAGLLSVTPARLMLLVFVTGVAGLGLAVLFTRRFARKLLRQEMVDAGVPSCRWCGYGLLGVTGGLCPECGQRQADRTSPPG